MENNRTDRVLEIFFRALRGEAISVKRLSEEYGVSTKSVTRSINELKLFLAEHGEMTGYAEMNYSHRDKCYHLEADEFLSDKELFAVAEILIGTKAFSKDELERIIGKLRRFTTAPDREKLNGLIGKELIRYKGVKHDCDSVQGRLYELIDCIHNKREISIDYYRMDRTPVTHHICPAAVMFQDYYFYLIAFDTDRDVDRVRYYRVDRIKSITVHRKSFAADPTLKFDEGLLRERSLYMWPGKLRTIRFSFCGPSVQAVLDKIPTAVIVERDGKTTTFEATVYGDGIKMWLLSQGAWVKALAPQEFVLEMQNEIREMLKKYE